MSPNSEKWLQAMKSEMQSMYDNQVWNLVDPPKGAKVIGCKWVHKIKHDMTFKSRLIAKGFKQTHGIDYDETFSPVVMLKSRNPVIKKRSENKKKFNAELHQDPSSLMKLNNESRKSRSYLLYTESFSTSENFLDHTHAETQTELLLEMIQHPGFTGSCYKIWSFPVGLELSYNRVNCILKYFS